MKKIIPLLLASIIAGNYLIGCGEGNKTTGSSPSLYLTGSKQGNTVGFADYDGDGIEDKLVGAPYAQAPSNTGAIVIYKGTTSGFGPAPLKAMLGDDNQGYSFVALGDLDNDGKNEYAAGAIHGDGEDVSLSGSVTIYKGGSNGEALAKLAGEWPFDKFGLSLTAGDFNNDGLSDLAVGAPFNTNDPALYQSGAVYIFFGPNFAASTSLYASTLNKGLGWSLSAGDINGDSIDDLLIGAAGKALAFYGATGFNPSINSPDLTLTGAAAGFGKTISIIGDIDAVPGAEIAIGAPNAVITLAGVSSRDVGSVYIVKGSAAGTINITASSSPADVISRIDGESLFSRFGSSLAPVGDIGSGGKPDFAVGAPMADTGWKTLSGKVYLFKGESVSVNNSWSGSSAFSGIIQDQAYGSSLTAKKGMILVGAPRSTADTGGVDMVNAVTGAAVPGGSSGGSTGGSGDCH